MGPSGLAGKERGRALCRTTSVFGRWPIWSSDLELSLIDAAAVEVGCPRRERLDHPHHPLLRVRGAPGTPDLLVPQVRGSPDPDLVLLERLAGQRRVTGSRLPVPASLRGRHRCHHHLARARGPSSGPRSRAGSRRVLILPIGIAHYGPVSRRRWSRMGPCPSTASTPQTGTRLGYDGSDPLNPKITNEATGLVQAQS